MGLFFNQLAISGTPQVFGNGHLATILGAGYEFLLICLLAAGAVPQSFERSQCTYGNAYPGVTAERLRKFHNLDV